ncbi:MAG: hypothetical protein LBU34_16635 [Planctomycetaceae bacterium]|nr:hypothetical protein [Planctomycetaceae bacterium]
MCNLYWRFLSVKSPCPIRQSHRSCCPQCGRLSLVPPLNPPQCMGEKCFAHTTCGANATVRQQNSQSAIADAIVRLRAFTQQLPTQSPARDEILVDSE